MSTSQDLLSHQGHELAIGHFSNRGAVVCITCKGAPVAYASTPLVDFDARVRKGIMVLNNHVPGWRKFVNPEFLDLANSESCMIGQTTKHIFRFAYAEDVDAVREYGGEPNNDYATSVVWLYEMVTGTEPASCGAVAPWAKEHGFLWEESNVDGVYVSEDEGYSALTEAWVHAIHKMDEADSTPWTAFRKE